MLRSAALLVALVFTVAACDSNSEEAPQARSFASYTVSGDLDLDLDLNPVGAYQVFDMIGGDRVRDYSVVMVSDSMTATHDNPQYIIGLGFIPQADTVITAGLAISIAGLRRDEKDELDFSQQATHSGESIVSFTDGRSTFYPTIAGADSLYITAVDGDFVTGTFGFDAVERIPSESGNRRQIRVEGEFAVEMVYNDGVDDGSQL